MPDERGEQPRQTRARRGGPEALGLRNAVGQNDDGGEVHVLGEHVGRREELFGVGQLTGREATGEELSLQQYIDPIEPATGVANAKREPGGHLDCHRIEHSIDFA